MRSLRFVGRGSGRLRRRGGGRCRALRPRLLGLLFLGLGVAAVQGHGCGGSMGLPARLFWLPVHSESRQAEQARVCTKRRVCALTEGVRSVQEMNIWPL